MEPGPGPGPGPGPEPEPEPEPEGAPARIFGANRAILCCRSGFFRIMLGATSPWREAGHSAGEPIEIGIDEQQFAKVNEFLHTGAFHLASLSTLPLLCFVHYGCASVVRESGLPAELLAWAGLRR